MKKYFLLVILSIMSLGCLQTVVLAEQVALATSTHVATSTLAVSGLDAPATSTQATRPAVIKCAVVVANEALHVRAEPNENALVLAWLKHGDQVKVISTANADWWLIKVGSVIGFARAIYLEQSACSKNGG